MKFKATLTSALSVRIPAEVVELMKLQAGDLVEVNIEHGLISLIAASARFTEYCRRIGPSQVNAYNTEYQESGGKKRHGSFKMWLVKKLNLGKLGLEYWTGHKSLRDIFPDEKLPDIEPVGSGQNKKES
jgi:antitoxin component of MazEF toxin-antitoxin module